MKMKINHNGGVCIYCNTSGAHDYAIHGRGAGVKINYFHKECYEAAAKKTARKEIITINHFSCEGGTRS